jgi:hypothetical protein
MKLKKYIFPLFLILMYSCSDITPEVQTDPINNSNIVSPIFRVPGDGHYDMLGYGFDATSEYLAKKKMPYAVIDIDKLQTSTGLVSFIDDVHSEMNITSGSDAKSLLTKYNIKFTVDGAIPIDGVPFAGSLSYEFTQTKTSTSKYSFAFADLNVYISHCCIKQSTPASTLQNYLTDGFKNDLLTMTPEQIIAQYGTHVYTDIFTGGRLRFIYQSYVNTSTKETSASYGAKIGVGKATDANLSVSASTTTTETAASALQRELMNYKAIGGTAASPIGTWTPSGGTSTTINFNQWSSTISKSTPSSLVLMDVGDNSLMAIYELVADPVKKEALKIATNNYILSNGLTILPVVPLYRYCNTSNSHFYTTNWNELGIGGNSWNYEGIQAFLFQNQEANTVPLYRFSNTIKNHIAHYYTTDKNSAPGYINEGILGYVYTTPINNNVVGLRQYYNPNIYDHLYTTSLTEIGNGQNGWNYEKDCCYVLDGTK